MIRRTQTFFAVTTIATTLISTHAFAQTTGTLNAQEYTSGKTLQHVNLSLFGNAENNVLAGTLRGMFNGGSPFDAYCVDLYDNVTISGNGTNYVVFTKPIASLTGSPHAGGNGGGVGYLYSKYAGQVTTGVQGAGLQIAIWKTVYDNGGSLTSGNFQFLDNADTNSIQHLVFQQANTYLSSYNGTQTGTATWFQGTNHSGNLQQDLVGPVPEPGTVAAMVIGMGGIAGLAYRRRRAGKNSNNA